jgi:long-chain acyl-CoA synthetase
MLRGPEGGGGRRDEPPAPRLTHHGGLPITIAETRTDRIWLEQYPPGVPGDIDPDAWRSLKEMIETSCREYADLPAFTNLGVSISFARLDRLSAAFAAWLQHVAGVEPGERVAIMLPNVLQYPVVAYGVLRAGCTVVNVNPMYTPQELRHQLADSGATTIVILENFARTLEAVIGEVPVKRVITTQLGDLLGMPKSLLVNAVVRYVKKMVPRWEIAGSVPLRRVLAEGARHEMRPVDVGPDDLAFLQYTGGTTGVAKGAMLTHRNMVANVEQCAAWLAPVHESGREVVITALPLYHIFSLTANCLLFTRIGGENVLITDQRDLDGFIGQLAKIPFTTITGVNTLFNALVSHPRFADLDFASLKVTIGGGMAVQRAVAQKWKSVTGRPIIEGYGLTETSPVACINPLTISEYTGAIGVPFCSTDVTIRDEAGDVLPQGEVGEICIAGPQVMKGYWQRDEDTAGVMTSDGALRTGDMGRIDERGFVFVTDRKKDMILVSGFNVYPNEIEDVVASHPDVLEAAAVGVPDERTGEAVKLFVVPRPGTSPTTDSIIAHCRKHLTNYKVPKRIEFRDELPKTNVGKILRRALRDDPGQGG